MDWDDNGTFDAQERQLISLEKRSRKAVVQLELGNKPLGVKRIRLQVGPTAEVGDPCSAPLLGDMQDGALELVEGLFVHRDDLELADLYIGESGRNLSATQPIQITLSNLSNREFSGKLKVRVTVDGRPPVGEFVDCGKENALEPYRGMRDFTLSTTADCTGIGRHTVKVELVDNPGTANNSRQANVYSIVPEPDVFYAVSIKSEAEQNERISVPTVAYALRRDEVDEWTMEMVFRTEEPQFGTLLEAYGFKVYSGLEVNEATVYDFSHDVEIVAKADLFGHKGVTQRCVLRFKEDLSHECELLALSLPKKHNPGLLVDLVVNVASQTLVLAPNATEGAINTPARVVLTFKLPDGAVLKLDNKRLESGVTPLDLTLPRMLTVVAANGATRHYELRLQQSQTIGWTLGIASYEYGSVPVPVEASASSGLPLTFTSTHPEVATVAGGRLHIGCPGTTTLAALQPGEGIWAEAKPITRQVTVTKRPFAVRMRDVLYKAGYPVVPQYEYSNLAKDADTASIPNPYGQGCFTVKDAEGREVTMPSELPVGVYTVDTVEGKHFATSCYTVSPQPARFEVVQADRW